MVNDELSPATVEALAGVFRYIIPALVLAAGACVLFLGATFRAGRNLWGAAALLTLAAAGVALYFDPAASDAPASVAVAPLVHDRLALLIKAMALAGAAVLVLCGWNE